MAGQARFRGEHARPRRVLRQRAPRNPDVRRAAGVLRPRGPRRFPPRGEADRQRRVPARHRAEVHRAAGRALRLRVRHRERRRVRHVRPDRGGVPGGGGLRHKLRRARHPHQPRGEGRGGCEGTTGAVALRPHPGGGGEPGHHPHLPQGPGGGAGVRHGLEPPRGLRLGGGQGALRGVRPHAQRGPE